MIARPGSVGDRWIGSYISSTQTSATSVALTSATSVALTSATSVARNRHGGGVAFLVSPRVKFVVRPDLCGGNVESFG